MKHAVRIFLFCCAALYFSLGIAQGAGKSLHWRDITVSATLANDGRLHINEHQTIVFNGDWNGGERRFALRPGQDLSFHAISRIEDNGHIVPLERGDLSRVDHYDWTAKDTLRWRSRLPGDPPFFNEEIIYLLEYSLNNILIPEGDHRYILDHDFAFSDRSGAIKHFRVELDLEDS